MGRDKNRDMLWLLEMALDVLSDIGKKANGFSMLSSIRNVDSDTLVFQEGIRVRSTIHNLLNSVCQAHSKESFLKSSERESLVLRFDLTLKDGNVKSIETNVETLFDEVECPKPEDIEGKEILAYKEQLQQSFLERDVVESYVGQLEALGKSRENLLNHASFFPEIAKIEEYLQIYYNILVQLLQNTSLLKSSEALLGLLNFLLRMDGGSRKLSNDLTYFMSLYAPRALNETRKMYIILEEYFNSLLDKETNYILDYMYQDAVVKKAQRLFRWHMVGAQKELLHVAITPCVSKRRHKGFLCVPCCDIRQYNSYEAVHELRTAEKIIYGLRNDFQEDMRNPERKEIHIALLGDLNIEASRDLAKYLQDVLDEMNMTFKLFIDIYTDDYYQQSEWNGINLEAKAVQVNKAESLDAVFINRESVCKVLQEHEMVFMLDCVKLYKDVDTVPTGNISFLKNQFRFRSPYDRGNDDRYDIALPNYFDELYDLMSIYSLTGYIGKYKKYANDSLLKVCEEEIHKLEKHTLYVYVSDESAFENLYCNDQYYLRTERYNQKEIGIILYKKKWEEADLPISGKVGEMTKPPKTLCFNLSQLFKHLCLEKCSAIIDRVSKEIEAVKQIKGSLKTCNLRHLYVGIDYEQWPQKLELHYAIETCEQWQKLDCEFAGVFTDKIIKDVILAVFNADREDMFMQYFWKAIYSFLYGDTANVCDMLLLHLLKNNSSMVGEASQAEENDAKRVENNIFPNNQYSNKRFYATLMEKFDISAEHSLPQLQVLNAIENSKDFTGGYKKIFTDVIQACEEMDYTHSYLYQNSIRQ